MGGLFCEISPPLLVDGVLQVLPRSFFLNSVMDSEDGSDAPSLWGKDASSSERPPYISKWTDYSEISPPIVICGVLRALQESHTGNGIMDGRMRIMPQLLTEVSELGCDPPEVE
jgi:hypothetical protein